MKSLPESLEFKLRNRGDKTKFLFTAAACIKWL